MRTVGLGERWMGRSTYTAALFLSAFTAQASVLVLSPLLPKIAEALGASVGAVGQLRTVSGGVACVTALALGGRPTVQLRNLIRAGVALLALGSLSGAVAPTLTALGLAQVPVGVGLAAVLVGAVAAAGEWPSTERRTGVVAWTLVGQAAAWVVGMPVVGMVAATAGWRAALMALPVSASVLALVATRGAPTGWAPNRSRDRRWLLRPAVARWALGELLAFSAWTLVYAGAVFATSYGAGPAAVGLVLGAGAAAYLPGNLAARRWVDRGPGGGAAARLPGRRRAGWSGPRRCGPSGPRGRVVVAVRLRRGGLVPPGPEGSPGPGADGRVEAGVPRKGGRHLRLVSTPRGEDAVHIGQIERVIEIEPNPEPVEVPVPRRVPSSRRTIRGTATFERAASRRPQDRVRVGGTTADVYGHDDPEAAREAARLAALYEG